MSASIARLFFDAIEGAYHSAFPNKEFYPRNLLSRYNGDPNKLLEFLTRNGHTVPSTFSVTNAIDSITGYAKSAGELIGTLHRMDSFDVRLLPIKGDIEPALSEFLQPYQRTSFLWNFGIHKILKGVSQLVKDGKPRDQVIRDIKSKIDEITNNQIPGAQKTLNKGLVLLSAFMKPEIIKDQLVPKIEALYDADKAMFRNIRKLAAAQT